MILFHLDIYPDMDHMVILFLICGRILILFPIVAVSVYIPLNSVKETIYFSPHSCQDLLSLVFFDRRHPYRCKVISHCVFDCHFSDDELS